MSEIAIRVENLGKQERYETLRDTLTDAFTQAFRRAVHKSRRETSSASKTSAAMYDLVLTPQQRLEHSSSDDEWKKT